MTQDLTPLHFHATHSRDIDITFYPPNRTVAKRKRMGQPNGFLFSSRPVKTDEIFIVQFLHIPNGTKSIKFGFTSHDPSTLTSTIASCTGHVVVRDPNFWTHSVVAAELIKNKILFFRFDAGGFVRFSTGDVEKKSACRVAVGFRLWALIELPNDGITVGGMVNCDMRPMVLHKFRGRNVIVERNVIRKNAVINGRKPKFSYGFTERPIRVEEYVIVKILDVDHTGIGNVTFGLTTCDPLLIDQKELPDQLSALVEKTNYTVILTPKRNRQFRRHEEISFFLARDGTLNIWKNGSNFLKSLRVNMSLGPLWGIFDLSTVEAIEVTCCYPKIPIVATSIPEDKADVKRTKDTDSSNCIVCFENIAETALYPCGHLCMCQRCARRQWRGGGSGHCPLCRVLIMDVLKIYKA